MRTTTKVKKWGNSLAIRLPGSVANAAGIADDTDVVITQVGNKLTIESNQPEMTIEQMFEGVTPEMVGGEIDWGPDVGRERWYDEE
ncbi:hypothetical protein A3J32_00405 [Candidatus Saccharibacteria bacterium RIFCSPLOWO2_02_FULL_46_7]|nr:MAG: hypothetical protein A3J32_00405 [Candidatus Saccharibacteria bacterium RIFCSPLOWO2_02_FULL_46_7]